MDHCQYCQKEIVLKKKSNKKYCSTSCRVKQYQYKQRVGEKLSAMVEQIKFFHDEREPMLEELSLCKRALEDKATEPDEVRQLEKRKATLETTIARIEEEISLCEKILLEIKQQEEQAFHSRRAAKRQKAALLQQQRQKGMSLQDFLSLQVETIHLPTALGAFLGPLERHQLCIAITAADRAGKSELIAAMASILSQQYSLCYYQLSVGIKAFQLLLQKHPLQAKQVMIKTTSSRQELQESASNFDCIIIDGLASEVELKALQQQYPATIFVVAMAEQGQIAEAAVVIEVVGEEQGRRVAIMKNNRFDNSSRQLAITVDGLQQV